MKTAVEEKPLSLFDLVSGFSFTKNEMFVSAVSATKNRIVIHLLNKKIEILKEKEEWKRWHISGSPAFQDLTLEDIAIAMALSKVSEATA